VDEGRAAKLGWACFPVALILATWPMAVAPDSQLLGSPNLEAVDHLWSLWAALRDGPHVIETGLVKVPEGYTWVLADPINLLWFTVPALLGLPALGFHLVHLGNMLVAAAAAVALGRELMGDRPRLEWLAATCAATAAPLCAGLFTGMTEAQTWGWAGLALAAVHRAARVGGWKATLTAGLLAGITAWCGVYTALYAAIAVLPFVISGLARGSGSLAPRAGAVVGTGAMAALLAAPVAWAVSTKRGDELPGSTSLTDAVLADPSLPQNRMLGGDLAGIFLPIDPPVGAELHAVYLGTATVLLGLLALATGRRPWALVASIAVLISLGLGLYLQAGGEVITTSDGRALLTPAAWASLAFEPLGRAPRWYRAIAVASVLWAPMAGAGAAWLLHRLPSRAALAAVPLLAAVVLADNLWVAPLTWPRDSFSALAPEGYDQLDGNGPIVEVPSVRFSTVTPGRPATASGGGMRTPDLPIRHPTLLWQTRHGHPLGGNPHQAERRRTDRDTSKAVDKLMSASEDGKMSRARAALRTLDDLGFTWVVHHPQSHEGSVTTALRDTLGPPGVDTSDLLAWQVDTLLLP